jgi:hypothetical protein
MDTPPHHCNDVCRLMYGFHCILPNGHSVAFENGSLRPIASAPPAYDCLVRIVTKTNEIHQILLQNLGEYFGFEYSPFLQYLHESCLRNYPHWGLDPDAPLLSTFCEDISQDLIFGKIHGDVYLREIGVVCGIDVGYGVFASAPIRINEFIGEYVGVVMESSTSCSSSYCLNYPAADRSFVINAREIGNLIRFVNHSPSPNSSFQPFMFEGIVHVLCVRAYDLPPSPLRS